MRNIAPHEALLKMKNEQARLIDVRTPPEYRAIHARGAEHHELSRLSESYIDGSLLAGRAENPLLIICKSGNRAAQAAKLLEGRTRAPVFVVQGGTDLWDELKLPVEKGPAVKSLERLRQNVALLRNKKGLSGVQPFAAFGGLNYHKCGRPDALLLCWNVVEGCDAFFAPWWPGPQKLI